jgi:eukaryotic-like serine/threonine-protein kinase
VSRYVVGSEFASGGMASVHFGRQRTASGFARTVAIKRPHPHLAEDATFVARFMDEARIAMHLRNPNVVHVLDVEAEEGLFLVMEYVHGESLATLLRLCRSERSRVPPDIAVAVARDVLDGLHAAHEAEDEEGAALGVVHRDVSPHNLLVGADGVTRVADFGVALAADRALATGDGRRMGKAGYMAPEQLLGGEIDRRADVYATGIVLWEMLTGRAFRWESEAEVVAHASTERAEPPSRLAPEVPSELDRAVLRALERSPARRYFTATDMARALEASVAPASRARVAEWVESIAGDRLAKRLEQLKENERAEKSTRSVPPPPRRGRWFLLGALVAALAGVVVGGVGLLHAHPPPAAPVNGARAAYEGALQALRDGDDGSARRELEHAVSLDPSMGKAHLRLALLAFFLGDIDAKGAARPAFLHATEHRLRLDAHERALLDAMSPVVTGDPADWEAAASSLAGACVTFPGDAELLYYLGKVRSAQGRFAEALRAQEAAIAADPAFVLAYSSGANAALHLGDEDRAARALERCTERTPAATRCWRMREFVDSQAGRCAAAVGDARRWAALEPDAHWPYRYLAEASFADGAPLEAVNDLAEQSIARSGDNAPRFGPAVRGTLAELRGDAPAAVEEARRYAAWANDRGQFMYNAFATDTLLHVFGEFGRPEDLAPIAEDFLNRKRAWTSVPRADDYAVAIDPTPRALRALERAGRIGEPEFVEREAAWEAEWRGREPSLDPGYLWIYGQAGAAETRDEAERALARLPLYEPLPPFRPYVLGDLSIGRTFLLAGRAVEAVPPLERAAHDCSVFDQPTGDTQASYWLGQAYEATARTAEACSAYERVLDRWGRAKGSVTAEKAAARLRALRCGRVALASTGR